MKTRELYRGKSPLLVSGIQTGLGILETTKPSYASTLNTAYTAPLRADFCRSRYC